MKLRASCQLDLHFEVPSPLILMLRPKSGDYQWIYREEYVFSEEVDVFEFTDTFGNLCQRIVAPDHRFQVSTAAEANVADGHDVDYFAGFVPVDQLPVEVLDYLLPSRYCDVDRLLSEAWPIIAGQTLGYAQVASITDWIRQSLPYRPGTSDIPLCASEVIYQGHGVCRDLAHVGIALCRSISIPARLVVGYLHELDPMDQHAWFEAYLGDRWFTFDPTQPDLQGGRIAVGYGRDAADVAIVHQFGPLPLINLMTVGVEKLSD